MPILRRFQRRRIKVRDLMASRLVTAGQHHSLTEVAVRMRKERLGALAIMHGKVLTGIITERDLIRSICDGISPGATPASAYMMSNPQVVGPEEGVLEAAERMVRLGLRDLPVVEGGRVIGFLSDRDLLRIDEACRELPELAFEPW